MPPGLASVAVRVMVRLSPGPNGTKAKFMSVCSPLKVFDHVSNRKIKVHMEIESIFYLNRSKHIL